MTRSRSTVARRTGAAIAGAVLLAACSAATRVEAAVTACNTESSPYVQLGGGGRSVTIDGAPSPGSTGAPMATVQCILKLLEVSDEVMAGIEGAAAADGPHSGDWDGLQATWTVTADGMRITITDTR